MDAPGEVTYEEAFTVQPFNNYLVSMSLTGAADLPAARPAGDRARTLREHKILQVSKGFSYQLRRIGRRGGQRADSTDDADQQGRVLPDRHEQLPLRRRGRLQDVQRPATSKYFGGLDIDAFADYLAASSPYTPGPLTRITK